MEKKIWIIVIITYFILFLSIFVLMGIHIDLSKGYKILSDEYDDCNIAIYDYRNLVDDCYGLVDEYQDLVNDWREAYNQSYHNSENIYNRCMEYGSVGVERCWYIVYDEEWNWTFPKSQFTKY